MNNSKLIKTLASAIILLLVVGCAAKRNDAKNIELKTGYARIQFETDNHIPRLFEEKLYGFISNLKTETDQTVDITNDGIEAAVRYIDVTPGTYKLQANCEPVNNHSGYQYNWLANYSLTIVPTQVITLGCQYYKEEETGSSISYKTKKRKKTRKVRIVELDSDFIE